VAVAIPAQEREHSVGRLRQLETFVAVASLGSLSAAARAEGVVPAVIARRLDALEARLGVKLLVRTTRRLTLTEEGRIFLDEAHHILRSLEDAESLVAQHSSTATGHLRLTAPAGFGRRHVAPLLPELLDLHPRLTASLDLTDSVLDLHSGRYDCAVRIGDLTDSSLVSVRLADNRRLVVAAPTYLERHGVPRTPGDLVHHNCLTLEAESTQNRGWLFRNAEGVFVQRVRGDLACNDGAVLLDWVLDGRGLAWRSLWEVQDALARGLLVSVLDEFGAPPNGIYAVFPGRRHLPSRVRAFIGFLRERYGRPEYWQTNASATPRSSPPAGRIGHAGSDATANPACGAP